jgi:hypothetical protein
MIEETQFFCKLVNKYVAIWSDYSQSDVEEYMSQNGITDLLGIGNNSSSSGTTTSPSSNDFNYSSDNTHSGDNKVKCNEFSTYNCASLK